ncbi:sulfatase-like hydrolase/transferase [Haladaptatus sp. F3-133]|uniref:Sulfatase-like hydrolase/transferase n=1 Tax=Halorutilus salinus TaxID=2487751 RepID=A0A9Q4GFY2_9EURY|nr:sulfatase-like hydrolase/transferase [Halorutilus salinus]
MRQPNILLVVWDACRYDYAVEHASFLNELASSNLSFENAVAPSPWSLPSHASIFTGEYPHEHGSNRFGDSVDTPLVTELSDRGYTTYGVSANGFASQRTGFHEGFDEFRYTGGRDPYVDGMDVSGTAQRILRESGGTYGEALREVLGRIPRHDHPLKSLANLVAVGCGELANKFESLQRIRHPVFAPTSDYSYKPENNTRTIRSMLRGHDDEPLFLFTNYMDTHRCYKPDAELQEKHLGRTLDYGELVRLNEEVAAPWAFESKKARDELDEEDVETLRGLYAGEVETADRHLRKLYETLDEQEMLEDTLIIVTADHGENLGETDEMGRTRMGHVASVSDAVLRVPLVVAHPELDAETIDKPVSLEFLHNLFVSVAGDDNSEVPSENTVRDAIPDMPATSQYPATGGGEETVDKYPEIPDETVHHQSSENSAVVYEDGWKVVAESKGERSSFYNGGATPAPEAPDNLVEVVEEYLLELQRKDDTSNLSDEDVSQLEALGYM